MSSEDNLAVSLQILNMTDVISFRIATESDHDELVELFEKHYSRNEPFNKGWINDDPVPEDIDLTLKALPQGTSFIAVDDVKNTIVGACITGVDDASSQQSMLDEASQTSNKKWAQYLRLYIQLEKNADVYQRFNVKKQFHVHGLAVNGDYRGRSIASKLVEKSFNLAASLGYKICSMYCSSFYTEQIALKLQMELIGEMSMENIRSETGERLVYSSPPHTHIRTYAKRL